MSEIPRFIEDRLRQPIPRDLCIVPGSTPVLSFGSLGTARVATLGLNPSRVEFLDRDGCELVGGDRRLTTHTSLMTRDLVSAPASVLKQIAIDCDAYFHRNPYRRWFDQLERVLRACEVSYYDGSACHLDLVQWATDPTWRRLDSRQRSLLIEADGPFLHQQLQTEHLRVLLVNGRGVLQQLEKSLGFQFDEESPITINGQRKSRVYSGVVYDRVVVVGWSMNLQSSFGVTSEVRGQLADRGGFLVADMAGRN